MNTGYHLYDYFIKNKPNPVLCLLITLLKYKVYTKEKKFFSFVWWITEKYIPLQQNIN